MDYMMRLLQRLILIIGGLTLGIYALIEKAGVEKTMVDVFYSIVAFILAFILLQKVLKCVRQIVHIQELVYYRILKVGTLVIGVLSVVEVLNALIHISQVNLWLTFITMGGMYGVVHTYNRRILISKLRSHKN